MSQFTITRGDTFLLGYQHGAPLAGTTFTARVRCGDTVHAVAFTVTDDAGGFGEFRADTAAWQEGEYLFQYRQVGGGITAHSLPRLRFTVEEPV